MCVLSGDIKILGAVKALYEANFETDAFKDQILYAKNNAGFSLLQPAIISGNNEINNFNSKENFSKDSKIVKKTKT